MRAITSDEGAAATAGKPNGPALWLDRFPWPNAETHKHNRGRLAIVGASPSRTGATRLSARAALRVGAGVVRMLCPPASTLVYAVALEAVILKPFADDGELVALAAENDVVLAGPNLSAGEGTRRRVEQLLRAGVACVLDADAISAFKSDGEGLCALTDGQDVLTPHTGEFARVFPGLLEQRGRESAVREAARRTGAVVVLKGANTLVAAPDGRLAVNQVDAPWLATLGTGDVLAGMVAGLRAQGMPPFEAANAAVWLHARAAADFGPGLTAEDLPDRLPPLLADLWKQSAVSGPASPRTGA